MRDFNYMKLKDNVWDNEVLSFVAQIREHKGKQNLYLRQKPVELERLTEIAKIQSTTSSNKIEGIGTSNARMRELVKGNTQPKSRDEQEIAGYRDVLNTIHTHYEHIPLTRNILLQLHRDLLAYTDKTYGGMFKNTQDYINETLSDGTTMTRFTPLEPFETPMAVEAICRSYQQALGEQVIDPLILIPVFVCDFLCIHPFNDGNGRMSRLLTTLLLHASGFLIGKYISIEQKIEKTKETYYDVLARASTGWHEGKGDYMPFIKYFLGIVLNSYQDFESRVGSVDRRSTSYEIVRTAVDQTLGVFTKTRVLEQCPTIGSSSVEAALKRLKEEGYILRYGSGKNTAYVRNPEYL